MNNIANICYSCKFASIDYAHSPICLITESPIRSTDTCEEWVDYND